ncbi:MAG: protein kinase, partial [Anaerolineae bacterium]|nr:protein kinase [Anaerolineae bacterium]
MPYQPGDTLLNKYRIEALIGRGAFGEVYRVKNLKLNVIRAIKILRRDAPGLGSQGFDEYVYRFQLEAQLGAKLNQDNAQPRLLQVHSFDPDGDLMILEMDYASGGSLKERMEAAKAENQPFSIADVLQIALGASQGLAVLHSSNDKIVHRDIHPGNILFDSQGGVKIADLGCAQTIHPMSGRDILGSQSPAHPGHPDYRSPEHENRDRSLTSAADIYMLGAVIFEILTGQQYNSLRPGTRAITLRTDTPAWLDDLLASMLSKDPEARPWDGKETAALLQAGIQREEIKRKAEEVRLAAEEKARRETAAAAQRQAEEQARLEAERRQAEKRLLGQESQTEVAEESKHKKTDLLPHTWVVVAAMMILTIVGIVAFQAIKFLSPAPAIMLPTATTSLTPLIAWPTDTVTITLIENPWPASELNATVAKIIIEKELGNPVEVIAMDEITQWDALSTGDADANLEVWPSGHSERIAEYIDNLGTVENGGLLGPVGEIGWFVPTYVIEANPALATWEGYKDAAADFASAETGDLGRFLGAGPNWVQYDEQIIANLGLPFQVVWTGSEDALLAEVSSAYSRQEPVLFYFYSPHAIF